MTVARIPLQLHLWPIGPFGQKRYGDA